MTESSIEVKETSRSQKGNRINQSFKGKTPSLNDADVKALIHKYPTNYVGVKEYLKKT